VAKYRRAARVDKNQREIVKALRSIPGVTVETGHDDILVGYRGRTYWFEIKAPRAIGADGRVKRSEMTDSEVARLEGWAGHYSIASSIDDILSTIKRSDL